MDPTQPWFCIWKATCPYSKMGTNLKLTLIDNVEQLVVKMWWIRFVGKATSEATGKLIKFIPDWDIHTFIAAAAHGHLQILQRLRAQ